VLLQLKAFVSALGPTRRGPRGVTEESIGSCSTEIQGRAIGWPLPGPQCGTPRCSFCNQHPQTSRQESAPMAMSAWSWQQPHGRAVLFQGWAGNTIYKAPAVWCSPRPCAWRRAEAAFALTIHKPVAASMRCCGALWCHQRSGSAGLYTGLTRAPSSSFCTWFHPPESRLAA